MSTALDIINKGYGKIGKKIIGQDLSTNVAAAGLATLNDLINLWANDNLLIYTETEETHTLVVNEASFTWGTAGGITTARPQEITGAHVQDSSGDDHPVRIIPLDTYHLLSSKTTAGRPYLLAYKPAYPLGVVYLYYRPSVAETLHLISLKEIGVFAATSTTVTFPPGVEAALVLNLAIELGDDAGVAITPSLENRAAEAKRMLQSRNVKHNLKPKPLDVALLSNPGLGQGNINTFWQ